MGTEANRRIEIPVETMSGHGGNLKDQLVLGTGEIGKLYGVKPGTVRDRWMGHPAFPAPHGTIRGAPIWLAEDIRQWVVVHRRLPGRPRKLR